MAAAGSISFTVRVQDRAIGSRLRLQQEGNTRAGQANHTLLEVGIVANNPDSHDLTCLHILRMLAVDDHLDLDAIHQNVRAAVR